MHPRLPGGAGLLTSTVANKSNSCYLHVLFCILIPSRELYIGNNFYQILWIPQCYKWKYLHQRLGMLFLQQNLNTEMMICLPYHLPNAINIFAKLKIQKNNYPWAIGDSATKHVFFFWFARSPYPAASPAWKSRFTQGLHVHLNLPTVGSRVLPLKGCPFRWGFSVASWWGGMIDVIDHNVCIYIYKGSVFTCMYRYGNAYMICMYIW